MIDQAALRRSFGTRVFNVDANGIATLVAPERQRLILGPDQPEDVYSIPEGSIYISAPTLFSTGHLMKPDGYGNLALFSQSDGLQTRVATFTAGGSVSMGQLPPPRSLWNDAGKLLISGTPVQLTRDGWQISSETNITNSDGEVVGSMSSAQYLEQPGVKGVQFYDFASGQSITFANGVLFVGHVDSQMYNANKRTSNGKPNVLIGGNQIPQEQRTIHYKCIPNKSTFSCDGDLYLRIETLRSDASQAYHCYNGYESDIDLAQTIYLKPDPSPAIKNAGVLTDLKDAAKKTDNPISLPENMNQIEKIVCSQSGTTVTVTFSSSTSSGDSPEEVVFDLDHVYSVGTGGTTKNIYLSCQCPYSESTVMTVLPEDNAQ